MAVTTDKRLTSVDADVAKRMAQDGYALTLKQKIFIEMGWSSVELYNRVSPARDPLRELLNSRMTIYSLLTIEELATTECRTVEWIECAVRAGYVFSDGALTSPNHFRDWLRVHPEFRAKHYILGGKRNPRGANNRQVYFIEATDLNLIKIGMAFEGGAARLRKLQTGSPVKLFLLVEITGDAALEARLHRQFAYLRQHGEWFIAAPELRAFIHSLLKSSRAEIRAARALITFPPIP